MIEAAAALRAGGVVLYPTTTLWGVGGDARIDGVVAKVAKLKGRAPEHPFLVLVQDVETARSLAATLSPAAEALIAAFWEGPGGLTLLLPAAAEVPRALVGPEGLVGVRIARHPVARSLAVDGVWLVSTSANPTGRPAPRTFAEVVPAIVGGVDAIARGGDEPDGVASTIVALPADGGYRVVREGAVSASRVAHAIQEC